MTYSTVAFPSHANVKNALVEKQILKLSEDYDSDDDSGASSTSSSSSYDEHDDEVSAGDNSGSESSWDDDMDELMDWFNGTIVTPHNEKGLARHNSMPVLPITRTPKKVELIGSMGKKSTSSIILNRLDKCGAQYFQSPDKPITSTKPAPKDDKNTQESPEACMKAIFKEHGVDSSNVVIPPFLEITQAHINAHSFETTLAARRGDLEYLRTCYEQGMSLQCCNRHGESIVHIICRRGHNKILKYMIKTAGVNVMVKDDVGRTPLHDAAWTAQANFKLVKTLLEQVPQMIHVKDSRNHTPLSYVPRQQWAAWCSFLKENQELLLKGVQH